MGNIDILNLLASIQTLVPFRPEMIEAARPLGFGETTIILIGYGAKYLFWILLFALAINIFGVGLNFLLRKLNIVRKSRKIKIIRARAYYWIITISLLIWFLVWRWTLSLAV